VYIHIRRCELNHVEKANGTTGSGSRVAAQFPSRALQRCSGVAQLAGFITRLTHCFLHFKRTPKLNSARLDPDTFVHVKWVPRHNGMARPDVVDGRNSSMY
jgi:hypothetical protein